MKLQLKRFIKVSQCALFITWHCGEKKCYWARSCLSVSPSYPLHYKFSEIFRAQPSQFWIVIPHKSISLVFLESHGHCLPRIREGQSPTEVVPGSNTHSTATLCRKRSCGNPARLDWAMVLFVVLITCSWVTTMYTY